MGSLRSCIQSCLCENFLLWKREEKEEKKILAVQLYCIVWNYKLEHGHPEKPEPL